MKIITIISTLALLATSISSFAAVTTFTQWDEYNFVTGGDQDIIVDNVNGVDYIITLNVSTNGPTLVDGGNSLNISGNTGGTAATPVYGVTFSVSSNFTTDFTISYDSLFARDDSVRIEGVFVESADGVTNTALTTADAVQVGATGVPTFTPNGSSTRIDFSIVQPSSGAVSTTYSNVVNFQVSGNEFTAGYSSSWGTAGESITFTYDPAVVQIPEPSSIALLGLGGLALLVHRRR